MVYLASEFAGDGRDQYEVYLNGLIQVWKNLRMQDMAIKAATAEVTNFAQAPTTVTTVTQGVR
jgi:hypothetical protein